MSHMMQMSLLFPDNNNNLCSLSVNFPEKRKRSILYLIWWLHFCALTC